MLLTLLQQVSLLSHSSSPLPFLPGSLSFPIYNLPPFLPCHLPSPSPPVAPIPGGCSLTSSLEIDPQLHTTFSTYNTTLYFQVCLLHLSPSCPPFLSFISPSFLFPPFLLFPPPPPIFLCVIPSSLLSLPIFLFPPQDSNLGYSPKSAGPPQCDSPNHPSIKYLKYNTYRKCLGAYNFDINVLFDAIEDMLTLQLVLRQVHLSCLYLTA